VAFLGVPGRCPRDGTAWVDTGLEELRFESAPYTAAEAAGMPAELIVVETDGTSAGIDRVRTAIQRVLPGAATWVGAEIEEEANRELTQLERLTNVALAISLIVAGCSLAVAVAGGIIERKRPFALLRLSGVHLAELQRVALLEAAAPLLLIALASAVLGLGVSAAIVPIAGERPWALPSIWYWSSLAGGLAVALGAAAAALPLLGRATAVSAVRFE